MAHAARQAERGSPRGASATRGQPERPGSLVARNLSCSRARAGLVYSSNYGALFAKGIPKGRTLCTTAPLNYS